MYHSKVMILCWAAVYCAGILAAVIKKRWVGLKFVLGGAAIMAAGIGASALLNNALGALLLSAALMAAAYFTLTGFIKILGKSGPAPE